MGMNQTMALFLVLILSLSDMIDCWSESLTSNAVIEPKSTIVVPGDSITYQAHFTEYLRTFFDTRYPAQSIKIINAGIPGHRADDGIARFDHDVAKWNPDWVMIMFGMNDGGYETLSSDDRFAEYQNNMQQLVAMTRTIDANPIIISPTPFDYQTSQNRQTDDSYRFRGKSFAADYDKTLSVYTSWCRKLADQEKLIFINLHAALNEHLRKERDSNPFFTLMPDAIHPDPSGHVLMAYTILNRLKPKKTKLFESSFQIEGSQWLTEYEGIQIRELKGSKTDLSFEIKLTALPWKIPEQHTLQKLRWNNPPNGPEMFRNLQVANSYNDSRLKVGGLARGSYHLSCDGQTIDIVTQPELVRGVNLDEYSDLPWNQKAMAVAALHRQISDEIVRPSRDLAARRFRLIRQADHGLAQFDEQHKTKRAELENRRLIIQSRIEELIKPSWHRITLKQFSHGVERR